jgi:hypothetical protein
MLCLKATSVDKSQEPSKRSNMVGILHMTTKTYLDSLNPLSHSLLACADAAHSITLKGILTLEGSRTCLAGAMLYLFVRTRIGKSG